MSSSPCETLIRQVLSSKDYLNHVCLVQNGVIEGLDLDEIRQLNILAAWIELAISVEEYNFEQERIDNTMLDFYSSILFSILVVTHCPVKGEEFSPLSLLDDPPPQLGSTAYVPIIAQVPQREFNFEDDTSTNELGNGYQYYKAGSHLNKPKQKQYDGLQELLKNHKNLERRPISKRNSDHIARITERDINEHQRRIKKREVITRLASVFQPDKFKNRFIDEDLDSGWGSVHQYRPLEDQQSNLFSSLDSTSASVNKRGVVERTKRFLDNEELIGGSNHHRLFESQKEVLRRLFYNKHAHDSPRRVKRDLDHLVSALLSRTERAASVLSPAIDAVDENPSHWRPTLSQTDKPQFVTSKLHRQATSMSFDKTLSNPAERGRSVTSNEDKLSALDNANPRSNEIPQKSQAESMYATSHNSDRNREYLYREDPGHRGSNFDNRNYQGDDYKLSSSPQRGRIIYYADLPEVVHHGPSEDQGFSNNRYRSIDSGDIGPYQTYEPSVSDEFKYPREGRFEDSRYSSAPIAVSTGDRYRYQPRPSYTIIDADRNPPLRRPYIGYQSQPAPPQNYYNDGPGRYNRIPSPYLPASTGRSQYDRPDSYDDGRRYVNGGQYSPRHREAVKPSGTSVGYSAPIIGEDPYRDYNPRQPAPWSMQIGTRLTVKDDGRPMNPRPGRPGRPFYVESQQGRDQYPPRFRRTDDPAASE
uniref:Uncharacterized protein n=1 Tax=Timema bartmani TaxID=61472 RepID=A0A7R9EQ61_9NEOP|nr:unnamed protein product [Timema bartmani]